MIYKQYIPLVSVLVVLTCGLSNGQNSVKVKGLAMHTEDTVDGWDLGCIATTNLTQTAQWNWAAGGQNSIAVNGLLSAHATETTGGGLWESNFDLADGVVRQGNVKEWWKTDDKFELTSKYGKKAAGKWYYAALFNFKTQIAPGYNYPDDSTKISDLLAPGYIILAIGAENKPEKDFGLYAAPVTLKLTMVNDQELADAGAFGVEEATYNETTGAKIAGGHRARTEFGCYLRGFYTRDIMENVTLKTELDLFSNYVDKPENIDVNWELLLNMKVNKYISASISTSLVYDNDIQIGVDSTGDGAVDSYGPRTQFKEVIGVGLSYKI